MDVLSLFDGISCARVALERAGVPIRNFVSVEIEKVPRGITAHNFPDTIHLEDVRGVQYDGNILRYNGEKVIPLDPANTIVVGGSPCQGFSQAGKGLNFNDPRSQLYFEFERIVNEVRPRFWLLENVRMKRQWVDTISSRMERPAVHIDSKVFTPLSRPRVYWFNWDLRDDIPTKVKTMRGLFDSSENVNKFRVALSEAALARCENIVARSKERGLGYKMPVVNADGYYLCLDKNIFKGADGKRGIIDDGVHPLRMPTPIECERLQGLPDDYTRVMVADSSPYRTKEVCKTNRYKALGNGWTVPVIEHIFKSMGK
mgnify:CR=1 FL=1